VHQLHPNGISPDRLALLGNPGALPPPALINPENLKFQLNERISPNFVIYLKKHRKSANLATINT
jgi:hypothetical protein